MEWVSALVRVERKGLTRQGRCGMVGSLRKSIEMSESSFQDLKGIRMAGLGKGITSCEGLLERLRVEVQPSPESELLEAVLDQIRTIPLLQWKREEDARRGAVAGS